MNILFVLPVLSEAYYRKRINNLRALGAECTVFGFKRNHYAGEPWDYETTCLGRIEDEKYFLRIVHLVKSAFKIRRAVKNQDVLYAFNLDILFLIWLGSLFQKKGKKIIYDVADIRPILIQKGIIPTMLRSLERFLLKRTYLVVAASPAYINGYFKKIQNAGNIFLVIENKVDERRISTKRSKQHTNKDKSKIVIGYFGGLRCKKSLEFLSKLIDNSRGKLHLYLRGFFFRTENYQYQLNKLKHVSFGGPFINPDDLEEMYSSVDLIWAAHMHGKTNTKWAISNRFYQACYFKCPLIAQEDTQDAKRVSEYGIGCIIDLNNTKKSLEIIRAIDFQNIERWKDNMYKIPKNVYTLSDEHTRLLKLISGSQ